MEKKQRLIDANAIPYIEYTDVLADDYAFRSAIDNMPTVDAVEVVRCKDCKYYTEHKKRCDHPCQDWDVECYDQWLEMEPSDFCSYGERRPNE